MGRVPFRRECVPLHGQQMHSISTHREAARPKTIWNRVWKSFESAHGPKRARQGSQDWGDFGVSSQVEEGVLVSDPTLPNGNEGVCGQSTDLRETPRVSQARLKGILAHLPNPVAVVRNKFGR